MAITETNNEVKMRFCEGEDCKKEKPVEEFPKGGYRKLCKKCTSKEQQKRYREMKANREMFF